MQCGSKGLCQLQVTLENLPPCLCFGKTANGNMQHPLNAMTCRKTEVAMSELKLVSSHHLVRTTPHFHTGNDAYSRGVLPLPPT